MKKKIVSNDVPLPSAGSILIIAGAALLLRDSMEDCYGRVDRSRGNKRTA